MEIHSADDLRSQREKRKMKKVKKFKKRDRSDSCTSARDEGVSTKAPCLSKASDFPETLKPPNCDLNFCSSSGLSKHDFFKELISLESRKPIVGTIHTAKKNQAVNLLENLKSNDWNCSKCSTSNFRQSSQCQKCGALKKITEWR